MPQSRFSTLLTQHGLPPSFIYLAPVLPIVQVMWADGRNQIPERAKLHLIMQAHSQALSDLAEGVEVVSTENLERFHEMFISNQPDMDMLTTLTGVATDLLRQHPDNADGQAGLLYDRAQLLHACIEIAATCESEMRHSAGHLFSQRIVEEERRFIEKVFALLPNA